MQFLVCLSKSACANCCVKRDFCWRGRDFVFCVLESPFVFPQMKSKCYWKQWFLHRTYFKPRLTVRKDAVLHLGWTEFISGGILKQPHMGRSNSPPYQVQNLSFFFFFLMECWACLLINCNVLKFISQGSRSDWSHFHVLNDQTLCVIHKTWRRDGHVLLAPGVTEVLNAE